LSQAALRAIFLLMDADSDGHHITTLLLTFFYRHLPGLIEAGHVFMAQPPLYRVDMGKETYWALDDADRDRIIKEKVKGNAKPSIMRFKGLGEMSLRNCSSRARSLARSTGSLRGTMKCCPSIEATPRWVCGSTPSVSSRAMA
jgi:DNA gyrase/topoisomerase IV subunit B